MSNEVKNSPMQTRRGNLKALGTGFALFHRFFKPSPAGAEVVIQDDQKERKEEKRIGPFDKIYAGLDQLIANSSGESKDKYITVEQTLFRVEGNYAAYLERLNALIGLTYTQSDSTGKLLLFEEYRKSLGAMQHPTPEDVIPYFKDKKKLLDDTKRMEDVIDKVLNPSKNDQKSTVPNKDPEYIELLAKGIADQVNQIEASEEGTLKGRLSVSIDQDLKPTPEGLKLFEEHKKKIELFLSKFPYFSKLFTKIKLFSNRYESKPVKDDNTGGAFGTRKESSDPEFSGLLMVNMDSEAFYSDFIPEIIFAHEAFGHGLDIAINRSFANRLTPEAVVERLAFQQQILNNPDWGALDQTIQQLFKKRKYPGNKDDFVSGTYKIDREDFVDVINNYPRNLIFSTEFTGGFARRPPSIYELILNNPYNPLKEAVEYKGEQRYEALADFMKDYVPILRNAVKTGNRYAKVLLWGLENFSKEFSDYDNVWNYRFQARIKDDDPFNTKSEDLVPKVDKTATTWSNYCNVVLMNVALYHAFINGIDNIRAMFSDEERAAFERHIYELREKVRAEVFAEGTAYSHYLGDRLDEPPPYRYGLAHAASLISVGSVGDGPQTR